GLLRVEEPDNALVGQNSRDEIEIALESLDALWPPVERPLAARLELVSVRAQHRLRDLERVLVQEYGVIDAVSEEREAWNEPDLGGAVRPLPVPSPAPMRDHRVDDRLDRTRRAVIAEDTQRRGGADLCHRPIGVARRVRDDLEPE